MPLRPYITQPLIPGEVYHLYNRTNEKGTLICYSEENYDFFLRRYFKFMTDYCDTYAYCVLPDHFHIAVGIKDARKILIAANRDLKQLRKDAVKQLGLSDEQPKDIEYYISSDDSVLVNNMASWAVSERFRRFIISYVKSLNKQIGRRGSLMQKPFRRKHFTGTNDIHRLIRYIHFNPVRHGYVDNITDYRWSSIHAYFSGKESRVSMDMLYTWDDGLEGFRKYHQVSTEVASDLRPARFPKPGRSGHPKPGSSEHRSDHPNILVTTLGMSWPIVPELLAFTNPEEVPLLVGSPHDSEINRMRQEYGIIPVNEVWIITTEGTRDRYKLKQWFEGLSESKLVWRIFVAKGVEDLSTSQECEWMTDMVFRTVLLAHTEKEKNGKVYLSLAGGRKTMSADMQQAAHIFGCDALIHVAAPPKPQAPLDGSNVSPLYNPIPSEIAATINPIVISGKIEPAQFLFVNPQVLPSAFPVQLPQCGKELSIDSGTELVRKIQSRRQNAQNLLFSFRSELAHNSMQQNFLSLYSLHPKEIIKLKEEKIGENPKFKTQNLRWLQQLPKAELHCHFGGILHPEDHIEVAVVMLREVEDMRRMNRDFDEWLSEIRKFVEHEDLASIIDKVPELRAIRNEFDIIEPLIVCGFLQQFDGVVELLQRLIYYGIDTINGFDGIGIVRYEKLGDLQGSGLLQSEGTIRKTLIILKRQCKEDHIRYLELRCSPCNYTRGGLSAREVVNIILDELKNDPYTHFRLIFIASRHREVAILQQHLALYHMMKEDPTFQKMFVGFDLAGNESAGKPGDLRKYFIDVMEDSVSMTIHAGEDRPAQSIWEAVYHLNADRIGHGLTLHENPALLTKFLNRRIAIEMCPSSNYQVVGYKDIQENNRLHRIYPLKEYFDAGLPVTINTDDPGMSLTTLSEEYYKAASMTRGGISKWDILQMVKNGFEYAFLNYTDKKNILYETDREINRIIV